jgi:hypothetical protein
MHDGLTMRNTMHPLTAKQTIINLAADLTETTDVVSVLSALRRGSTLAARNVGDAVDLLGQAAAVELLRSEIKAWSKRRARWAKTAKAA